MDIVRVGVTGFGMLLKLMIFITQELSQFLCCEFLNSCSSMDKTT